MPDELSFEEGAAIGCGAGTAWGALMRLELSGHDTLAVFGQGPVGLSATIFGAAMGARVIAIEVVPERLELATKLGAWKTVDASKEDPVAAIRELTHGEGANVALDCTGIGDVRRQAIESAGIFGRVSLVGVGPDMRLPLSIGSKYLTLRGSRTLSTVQILECAQFVVHRQVPLKRLITHTFPLDQVAEAYTLFDTNRTGKMAIVWE